MKRFLPLSCIVAVSALLVALAIPLQTGLSKPPSIPKQKPISIEYGTVMEAFPFTTDGHHSGIGMGVGAVVGGAVGASNGLEVTQVGPYDVVGVDPAQVAVGAVVGGLSGMMVEKAMNSERLVQIHVLLENGDETTVTQRPGKRKFKVNDPVKILRYSRTLRIVYHQDEKVDYESNPYLKGSGIDQTLPRPTPGNRQ